MSWRYAAVLNLHMEHGRSLRAALGVEWTDGQQARGAISICLIRMSRFCIARLRVVAVAVLALVIAVRGPVLGLLRHCRGLHRRRCWRRHERGPAFLRVEEVPTPMSTPCDVALQLHPRWRRRGRSRIRHRAVVAPIRGRQGAGHDRRRVRAHNLLRAQAARSRHSGRAAHDHPRVEEPICPSGPPRLPH